MADIDEHNPAVLAERLTRSREGLDQLEKFLELPAKRATLAELEARAGLPGFWDNTVEAQKTMKETNALKSAVQRWSDLHRRWEDLQALRELAAEGGGPAEWAELSRGLDALEKDAADAQLETKLSGPMDRKNAILSIHAGAGGTESCDWVEMLLRMFTRWAERRGFTAEVLSLQPGEEAGLKRAVALISGPNAYGFLQSETGVHRLVRISPYDANARRHTSFAACDVIPEIDDDIQIEIKDVDLKIDTYRAGGHGGQYVNKTESAVRMTHLPTGIIVQSQNERSQFKNRSMCLKLLKAKLYDFEMEKQRAATEKHYDAKGDIAWGNQIRSYVFMPYQMVKDLRSGHESSQVDAVMDGDLDPFIHAYLEWKLSGEKPRRSATVD